MQSNNCDDTLPEVAEAASAGPRSTANITAAHKKARANRTYEREVVVIRSRFNIFIANLFIAFTMTCAYNKNYNILTIVLRKM
jgi:hypothetical protein